MTPLRGPGFSRVLVIVLIASLATGAAASILVGATTAPPPSGGRAYYAAMPEWIFVGVIIGILCFLVGMMVLLRLAGGRRGPMSRMYVSSLTVILLGVLAVVILRSAGVGGQPDGSGTLTPTSPPPPPPVGGGGGGNLTGPGGVLVLFPGLPPWFPIIVLAAALLLFVVVGLPRAQRYLTDRAMEDARKRAAANVPAGLRDALSRASADLESASDPRLVILALYQEMLGHLRPFVESYAANTPEEIREIHLDRLGVRPEAARTLTRLFEEARYSTHPMGLQQSESARDAVRMTLEDLDRRAHRA